tara:strand:+ start:135 stop:440 length:306 start_codon:yes stop_codon:yes gene_type:complete
MPSKNPKIQKALKDGKISKKQYDKLGEGMLLGIIKKKSSGKATTTSKGMVKKTAKLAYEKSRSGKKSTSSGKGTKETRKKLGKEAHKRGRPKSGSKVEIEK